METPEDRFIGYTFKDDLSGFCGVCTVYARYISGSDRVGIEPRVGDDGKKGDCEWFDIGRLIKMGNVARVVLGDDEAPAQ